MQAIRVHTPGGPEALVVEDLPTPEPAAGQVRVRAEAIGVGRPDVLIRQGSYKWMPPLPAIPGAELVGTVDALGEGAAPELLGRLVLVSARELTQRGGCYVEAICVPASAVFVLPEGLEATDATNLPNIQLALALLQANGGAPMASILVPGAAGGVGSALTQVAHARGLRVIGTARGDEKRRFALDNGVQALVAADPATLADEVRALTNGNGVDMAFDHLGGDWLTAGLRALAPMGMLVSYNLVLGFPARESLHEMRALLGRSLALRTFSMHTYDAMPAQRRALMVEAIALMASGRVRPPPTMRLALSAARLAHERLDRNDVLGKIVLIP